MTGAVDAIDLGAGTFTVDGVVIHVNANTVWKGARGSDVRSLGELHTGQDVNLDLDRDTPGVIAQQIFVVGFIPPMIPNFFGFVTNISGDLWTITTADNGPIVVRVTDRTIFNSSDGVAQPALGEFVDVTTDGGNPPIALVITDFPPPQQQIQYSYGVFGTLSAIDSGSLTITDLNGHTVTLPTDANTMYYRGVVGDYVEVRVRVDDATKAQVVVQVIKTNRTIRLGGTGTVKSIDGNTWTIDIWTVIVSPQTKIINNPRVGDTVRFVGTTEHGSNTIQADEIERL